jgi:hypothetical protein
VLKLEGESSRLAFYLQYPMLILEPNLGYSWPFRILQGLSCLRWVLHFPRLTGTVGVQFALSISNKLVKDLKTKIKKRG